ncbi:MAG: hypothetical protein RL467_522 [Actinomycetota bacterium]
MGEKPNSLGISENTCLDKLVQLRLETRYLRLPAQAHEAKALQTWVYGAGKTFDSIALKKSRPDHRVTARYRGKSGLQRAKWWVTPTRSNPRDKCNRKQTANSNVGKGETAV